MFYRGRIGLERMVSSLSLRWYTFSNCIVVIYFWFHFCNPRQSTNSLAILPHYQLHIIYLWYIYLQLL
jgi:hypothetical protein